MNNLNLSRKCNNHDVNSPGMQNLSLENDFHNRFFDILEQTLSVQRDNFANNGNSILFNWLTSPKNLSFSLAS